MTNNFKTWLAAQVAGTLWEADAERLMAGNESIELRLVRDPDHEHLISVRRGDGEWSVPEPYWVPGAKRLQRAAAPSVDTVMLALAGAEALESEGGESHGR